MAITRVNMGSHLGNSVASATVAVTVGTGPDRALVVTLGMRNSGTRFIGTLTYAGVSLTRIEGGHATGGTGVSADAWYMIAPTSGVNDLVASTNDAGSLQFRMVFADYEGVDQTNPLADGTVGGVAKTGVSSIVANDDLAFGQVWDSAISGVALQDGFLHERTSVSTMTAQTGRTEVASADDGLFNTGGSYTLTTGTGSFPMTWDNAAADNYGHAVVALRPAAAAGATPAASSANFIPFL